MSKATITVNFTPGDSIESAFQEAIRLATLLSVWVKFNFNGVECLANSYSNVSKGVESYMQEINKDSGSKVAFA